MDENKIKPALRRVEEKKYPEMDYGSIMRANAVRFQREHRGN